MSLEQTKLAELYQLINDTVYVVNISKDYTGKLDTEFAVAVLKKFKNLQTESGDLIFGNETLQNILQAKRLGFAVKEATLGNMKDLEILLGEMKENTLSFLKLLKSGIPPANNLSVKKPSEDQPISTQKPPAEKIKTVPCGRDGCTKVIDISVNFCKW